MTEKMSAPKQFVKAFQAFKKTEDFYTLAKQSTGSKLLYAFLLAILCSLITFGIGGLTFANNKNLADIMNSIPDFTYSNGNLSLQEKYVYNEDELYFNFDTNAENIYLSSYDTAPAPYATSVDSLVQELIQSGKKSILLASKTNMILVDLSKGKAECQEMKYSEFGSILHITSLSKQDIVSGYKGVILKFAAILGLIVIPIMFVNLFFISLLLSLVGLIVNSIVKETETFGNIYWISFYICSYLTIVSSIFNVFFNRGIKLLLFLFYIYMIQRIIKHGESDMSVITPTYTSSLSQGNYGVVEDDYEAFMKRTEPSKSAFDFSQASETTAKPVVPDTIRMNRSDNSNVDSYYGNTTSGSSTSTNHTTSTNDSAFSFDLRSYEPTNTDNTNE